MSAGDYIRRFEWASEFFDLKRAARSPIAHDHDLVLQQGFGFDLGCRDRPCLETQFGPMRPQQFNRLLGRPHGQGDAYSGMGMLECDDLRQQIRAGRR